VQIFTAASLPRAQGVLAVHGAARPAAGDPRPAITQAVRPRTVTPASIPALSLLVGDISRQIASSGSLAKIPFDRTANVRNYLVASCCR
jgi:hypothetical protein